MNAKGKFSLGLLQNIFDSGILLEVTFPNLLSSYSAKKPSILGWIARNTANVENWFHKTFTREMSKYGFLSVKWPSTDI